MRRELYAALQRWSICFVHLFVYFARIDFYPSSLLRWLRLVIVTTPGLFLFSNSYISQCLLYV